MLSLTEGLFCLRPISPIEEKIEEPASSSSSGGNQFCVSYHVF